MSISPNFPAIYVHNTKAVKYADAIVEGYKTIETRTRDVLGRFVGCRVLIIRTDDNKKPMVIGSVSITYDAYKSAEALDELRDRTLIPPGSKFDCHGCGKWCYFLRHATKFSHEIPLSELRVKSRCRSYAMIETDSICEWLKANGLNSVCQ